MAKAFDFVLRVVSLCRMQIGEEFSLLVVRMVACARRCAILGNISKIGFFFENLAFEQVSHLQKFIQNFDDSYPYKPTHCRTGCKN